MIDKRVTITVSGDLLRLLDIYRYGVKTRTGKLVTYGRAVVELLEHALKDIKAPEPRTYAQALHQLDDLQKRVKALEVKHKSKGG